MTASPPEPHDRPIRRVLRANPDDREILRLAIPALGALVAEPLYILCDTAVVGHLGTDQLAGLAVASSILLLLYSIFIFLAYGTTAAVARLLGADQEADAAHQAVQGMWLALVVGLALVVLGAATAPWLVSALGATGAVAANALVYLRISLIGIPGQLVVLAGTGYLRGLQDTRTPLLVSAASALGNLVLEVVLIYGLGFGIGASALSTVVAQLASAGVYVWWVHRAVRHHEIRLGPHGPTLRRLAVVGGDLFVRTLALRGALVVATAVAARLGTVALAAHQIAFQIWNLLALALDAIAIAGQALVGRFLGARDVAAARQAGRRMIEWGLGAGVGFGLVTFALRDELPHIFSRDPAVVAVAAFVLVFVAVMQPVNGVVFVLDGLLIGAGDLRYLAVAMLIPSALFAALALGVLRAGLGIGWLWSALIVFMLARLVGLAWRWSTDRWAVTGAARAGGTADAGPA